MEVAGDDHGRCYRVVGCDIYICSPRTYPDFAPFLECLGWLNMRKFGPLLEFSIVKIDCTGNFTQAGNRHSAKTREVVEAGSRKLEPCSLLRDPTFGRVIRTLNSNPYEEAEKV